MLNHIQQILKTYVAWLNEKVSEQPPIRLSDYANSVYVVHDTGRHVIIEIDDDGGPAVIFAYRWTINSEWVIFQTFDGEGSVVAPLSTVQSVMNLATGKGPTFHEGVNDGKQTDMERRAELDSFNLRAVKNIWRAYFPTRRLPNVKSRKQITEDIVAQEIAEGKITDSDVAAFKHALHGKGGAA
jgi:hypothetical protein